MSNDTWDETTDVVVAGAGAAGLVATLAALRAGADTVTLEKDPNRIGGTMRKSVGALWVPNNRVMRENGVDDPRDAALRYMARLGRPGEYDPTSDTLGLAAWEYELCGAFYDNASAVFAELEDSGAISTVTRLDFPDFFAHLPENESPHGRRMFPGKSAGAPAGGQELADDLAAAIRAAGGGVRMGTRVLDVVVEDGRVTGVVAETPDGVTRIRARRGVVFGTGGFARNRELRQEYLTAPYGPGCSAITNTGDFVYIARRHGAHLVNMGYPWTSPIVTERALKEPDTVMASFYMPGDGFVAVNRAGRRVMNEKAPYNEFTRAFFEFDATTSSYPNLPLILIWDQAQHDTFGNERLGNPIPPDGVEGYWLVEGADLAEVARGIDARLEHLGNEFGEQFGAVRLDPSFATEAASAIERYNGLAESGEDVDYRRGGTPFELHYTERMGPGTGPNITMRPLDTGGPYYATIIGPAAFETKGGPRIDPRGRVFDVDGAVIDGLFAAGNCSASPSVEAYWSGGISIALAFTFGWSAGTNAAKAGQSATSRSLAS